MIRMHGRLSTNSLVVAAALLFGLAVPSRAENQNGNKGRDVSSVIVFDYRGGNPAPSKTDVMSSSDGTPAASNAEEENPFKTGSLPSWALWRRGKLHPDGERFSLRRGLGSEETFVVQVRNANVFKYQVGVTVTGENWNLTVPDAFKNFGAPVVAPPAAGRSRALDKNKPWQAVLLIQEDLDRVRSFGTLVRTIVETVDVQAQRTKAAQELRGQLTGLLQRLSLDVDLIEKTYFKPMGDRPNEPAAPDSEALPDDNSAPARLVDLTEALIRFLPRLRELLRAPEYTNNTEAQQGIALAQGLEQQAAEFRRVVEQIAALTHTALYRDYLTSNFGPYQVTTDSSTITVTVLPIASNTQSATPAPSSPSAANVVAVPARTVRLRTTTGFKIDFSAGLLITGLTDKNYHARSKAGTAPYKIREASRDDFSFNAAAFTHFYWRRPGFLSGYGISLGIAARNNPIYGIGASLFFGERQRVVFTAGLAFGSVSRLNGFEEGDTISTTVVPTANRVRSAPFAGLSYNF